MTALTGWTRFFVEQHRRKLAAQPPPTFLQCPATMTDKDSAAWNDLIRMRDLLDTLFPKRGDHTRTVSGIDPEWSIELDVTIAVAKHMREEIEVGI